MMRLNYLIPVARTVRRSSVAVMAMLAIGCASIDQESDMTQSDPMMDTRSEYIEAVAAIPDDEMRPVSEFEEIPGDPYFESRNWNRRIFKSGFGPHADGANAQHSFHVAVHEADFDLLRHQYEQEGVQFNVTESRVFLYMEATGPDIPGPDLMKRVTEIANTFLRLEAPVKFYPVGGDSKRKVLSSQPALAMQRMKNWTDRIDVIATGNSIGLLCYKMAPDVDTMFLNPAAWFPTGFPKLVGQ